MILYFAEAHMRWVPINCPGDCPILIAYTPSKGVMEKTRKYIRRIVKDRNRKGKSNDYGKG